MILKVLSPLNDSAPPTLPRATTHQSNAGEKAE